MSEYADNCQAVAIVVMTRLPQILWGDPGQGKSTFIEAIGAAYNFHTESIFASNSEPSDFAGMPVVNPSTGQVNLSAAPWARRLVEPPSSPSSTPRTAPTAVSRSTTRSTPRRLPPRLFSCAPS